jgi:hypothetical protein
VCSANVPRVRLAELFPVVTFGRVFDVQPASDVLTLAELVACFRRFERRPELRARIERNLARIERARAALDAGEALGGPAYARLIQARDEARARGVAEAPAVDAALEELRAHARGAAKRDLRLWSPAVYRPLSERGSENVTHLSCLVLDYDAGVGVQEASATWAGLFHCIHSTWSYTPSRPKFRVILPLATLVPASEWERLWAWADARADHEVDRALKGPAATFALPATPDDAAPRVALTQPGRLLDPRELGIDVGQPPEVLPRFVAGSPMRGDPEHSYLEHRSEETVYVYGDDLGDDELEYERPSLLSVAPIARPGSPGRRETVCVDFDGVLHSYVSGWRGPTVIPDPPIPGAIEFVRALDAEYDVAIFSTRTSEEGAIDAMRSYLIGHGLPEDAASRLLFPRHKVPARLYIDDRGWRFEGTFPTLAEIRAFEPYRRLS